MTLIVGNDVALGYWLEWRSGKAVFYTPDQISREGIASGAEIRGLFRRAQLGCSAEPAAYRGRYWHLAKNYPHNISLDPYAIPLYLGQVISEPDELSP